MPKPPQEHKKIKHKREWEKRMMYDILTIGEILVEILTEHTGQVFYRPGTLLGPYPSGAPAIFIDQAARMGARSAIIAKVGKDDFARLNLDRLAQDGVDTAHIRATAENSTGSASLRGTCLMVASERHSPVTMPRCAALCCSTMSMRVARVTIQRRL